MMDVTNLMVVLRKNSRPSTSDNMFVLLGAIQRIKFLRKPLYVAFVDFRRAFDTVNRNMMFYQLFTKKIDGKLDRLLHDMYSLRRPKLKYVQMVTCLIFCMIPLE